MTVQVCKLVLHTSKGDATSCVHVHAHCRPHIEASATAANPYQEERRTWQASCNVPNAARSLLRPRPGSTLTGLGYTREV